MLCQKVSKWNVREVLKPLKGYKSPRLGVLNPLGYLAWGCKIFGGTKSTVTPVLYFLMRVHKCQTEVQLNFEHCWNSINLQVLAVPRMKGKVLIMPVFSDQEIKIKWTFMCAGTKKYNYFSFNVGVSGKWLRNHLKRAHHSFAKCRGSNRQLWSLCSARMEVSVLSIWWPLVSLCRFHEQCLKTGKFVRNLRFSDVDFVEL